MAMAHRHLLQFIGRLPGDPLVAMFAQVQVNTALPPAPAQPQNMGRLPAILTLPMMCELFSKCFAELTPSAGTDSPAGTLFADWSDYASSCPRRREPSS